MNKVVKSVSVDEAFRVHQEIVGTIRQINSDFLKLGKLFHWVRENSAYLIYGHPTMRSYFADPEISVKKSMGYRLIKIHEIYVLWLKCPPGGLLEVGPNKLDLMKGIVTPDNVDEWISKASSLSYNDVCRELNEEFALDLYIPEIVQRPPPPPMTVTGGDNGADADAFIVIGHDEWGNEADADPLAELVAAALELRQAFDKSKDLHWLEQASERFCRAVDDYVTWVELRQEELALPF